MKRTHPQVGSFRLFPPYKSSPAKEAGGQGPADLGCIMAKEGLELKHKSQPKNCQAGLQTRSLQLTLSRSLMWPKSSTYAD